MILTDDFYSFRHGVFDITVLSDGEAPRTGGNWEPQSRRRRSMPWSRKSIEVDDFIVAQSNIPLIVSDQDIVLVDVGLGDQLQGDSGLLEENRSRIGVRASDITMVVLTHAHLGHIGGITRADGTLRYKNARYFMAATEWAYWMTGAASPSSRYETQVRSTSQAALRAVGARLTLVDDGDEIVPDMRVLTTEGHTPGHISLVLESDIPLIITGDATANDTVPFENPEMTTCIDRDPPVACNTRRRLLEQAVASHAKLLGFHWPYPGVGRADRDGAAFRLQQIGKFAR
jgi:glyoxylase-like metal-dependent hydrolase (beta-lactamase superfamily II)